MQNKYAIEAVIRRAIQLFLVMGLALPCAGSTPMGQILGTGATLDGIEVPPGTTLLSPALVQAGDRGVLLQLNNGQTLTVGRGTSTELESSGQGGIRLTVTSGEVLFRQPSGALMMLVANNEVVLDARGQVREGAPVAVKLCRLSDSRRSFRECIANRRAAGKCDWELIEVPPNEVARYLGTTAVRAGVENNDLGLDETCAVERRAAGLWTNAGPAAKAGMVAGSVFAGFVIYDQIEEDDKPASPVTP